MRQDRSIAQSPWRSVVTQLWLTLGTRVRDEFGEWKIVGLPDEDSAFGYAQIEIADIDCTSVYTACRHVWLNEFLRDFTPVT